MFFLCSVPAAMGTVSPWMSVPSACLSAHFGWLLLPVTDLLVGKELKILRSHSLAEVRIEQSGFGLCFQEDGVDTRATNWLADTNCPSLPHRRLARTPTVITKLPSLNHPCKHICTQCTTLGIMELLRLEKTSCHHQVCPTTLCIFLPTFSVDFKFL